MKSIFLSHKQVFESPLPLFRASAKTAAATDLALLTVPDDGFALHDGDISWYLADGMCVHSMVRSSINSQKMMTLDRIQSICDAFKAKVETKGTYPAWELIEKSAFRDLAADVYQKVTGTKPTVVVIHGGLECGLLAAKVPGLDCISLGPDMEEVHTPAERLNIPSSKRTYDYIKALLEVCADA